MIWIITSLLNNYQFNDPVFGIVASSGAVATHGDLYE